MISKPIITLAVTTASLLLGLAAGTLGSLYLSSQTTASNPEKSNSEEYTADDYDVAALRDLPSTPLPDQVVSSELSDTVDVNSARLLHEDGDKRMYVAMESKGMICLILYIGGEDWVASTTCSGPDSFEENGVGVRTNGVSGAAEGYLLPDSIAPSIHLQTDGLNRATESANLLTLDPSLNTEERDAIELANPDVMILPEIEDE